MQPQHHSAIWMEMLGRAPATDRNQTLGERYLEEILAMVSHPPLRHYLQGLWNEPRVLARVISDANEPSSAALLWQAVRLVRNNPAVQPAERDLGIVVTVLTGMRTLVYPPLIPESSVSQKDEVLVRQALINCAFESIRTLAMRDRGSHWVVQQAIRFHTSKQAIALAADELKLHSRLMTIGLLAWSNCHAKQAIRDARP